MRGLMMDYQLTLPTLLRRAETYFPQKQIVTRLPDRSFHRYTYADSCRRARQLAVALQELGLERGDRVATLAWNHYQHHECYLGIPCGGFVLHTLNLRLHASDLAYIASHAGDRAVIVDRSLVPLLEQFKDETAIEHVFVVEDSYEDLLASADPGDWRDPELDENEAAAMCYTSGTTGRPKGVVYSHRSTILHSMGAGHADAMGIRQRDRVMPVEPIASEKVTMAAGVPTIWQGILQLEDTPDLSSLRMIMCGGSAVPESLIRAYDERFGVPVLQGWGMTETSPLASTSRVPGEEELSEDEQYKVRALQGRTLPLVEYRIDEEAGGELQVRGPWVARSYYNDETSAGKFP